MNFSFDSELFWTGLILLASFFIAWELFLKNLVAKGADWIKTKLNI